MRIISNEQLQSFYYPHHSLRTSFPLFVLFNHQIRVQTNENPIIHYPHWCIPVLRYRYAVSQLSILGSFVITLTEIHLQILKTVAENDKLIEDVDIINNFGVTAWLDLWRAGLVLTDQYGYAYLTTRGIETHHGCTTEEKI